MKKLLTICVILLAFITAHTESAWSWEYKERVDKMSGEMSRSVIGTSKNRLIGWADSTNVYFKYFCDDYNTILLMAFDVGFHVDDVRCTKYSCENVQMARIKLDKSWLRSIPFRVSEDNNEIMELSNFDGSITIDGAKWVVSKMKAGNNMYLEIKAFNTKGKRQIVEFDLNGFTAAINQCK